VPHEPDDRSFQPVSRPASAREIFSPAVHDENYSYDPRPPLALPKKRPLIMWIGIALLLGGLIALVLVFLSSDLRISKWWRLDAKTPFK
jgi:hypothetical protein